MKKAVNIWAFNEGKSIINIMKTVRDAGYDGIELALDEKGEVNLNSTKEDMIKIKNIAKEVGLEIPSLASGLYWKYSFTSGNEENRKKAKEIAKKQIELASYLGADTVLIVPGAVGVDFIPNCEIVDYDLAYDRALDAFMELKDIAEKFKVSIGIENVWNKFLLSPLEMRDFIDKVNSEYIGAYLDVGNLIYIGYPEQWIKILGKRIKKVHFKDFNRSVGNLSGFVDILSGDVNFPKIMNAFKEVGYDNYVTAEVFPYKDYPEQIVYNVANSMDKILERK